MQSPACLPDRVRREFLDRIEIGLRMQFAECAGEDQRFAVEHDSGVGGKHEIGKVRRRVDELDRGAFAAQKWLLPADSKSSHIAEPKLCAGDPFSSYDLRRIYSTDATEIGVNPYHLKLLLNHSLPKSDVTAGYVHMGPEELRP